MFLNEMDSAHVKNSIVRIPQCKKQKNLKKWSDEFLNVLHTVHKVHTTTLYILY